MNNLGYNMNGAEEPFEAMLRKAIHEMTTPGFQYLEIGIAEGTTLLSAATVLRDALLVGWRAIGIDLVDGPYFKLKPFLMKSLSFDVNVHYLGHTNKWNAFVNNLYDRSITIELLKSPDNRALISPNAINFALIDGCHGASCVIKDFESIEHSIAPGGIVAFHDAGDIDQGQSYQPHCQEFVGVQEALLALELDPVLGKRPSWKYIGKIDSNPDKECNGFAFYQKTGEIEVTKDLQSGTERIA